MNISSYMPTKLITGKGCVAASAKAIASVGNRCLIVTGRHAAKSCGALDDVTAVLDVNGQSWALFDAIGQNPKLTDCMDAAKLAAEFRADFIIGIGGGSALDAAKCIAVLAANPGMTQQQLYAFDWPNAPLKNIAVGTTAGTGSEVTKVSVITTPDGRKRSFHHEAVFPCLSLGDPGYTVTLSELTTRSTAIDVLAHCTESFFSRNANHISQAYAIEGLKLLLPVFKVWSEQGFEGISYETREKLYCASIYGGLAINITGTAFPHTMGYLLTEKYSIPHGTACAVFQKAFLSYNEEIASDITKSFFDSLGCSCDVFCGLIDAVIPPCEVTMTKDDIAAAHPRWVGNGSMAKCLGCFTPEMADDVLSRLFIS